MQRHQGLKPRQTKLVATLGLCPEENWGVFIDKLLDAGVDVFRLNFSHCEEDHGREKEILERVHSIGDSGGHIAAILGDLQGPKLRISKIPSPGLKLEKGASVIVRIHGGAGEIPLNETVGHAILRSVRAYVETENEEPPTICFGDGDMEVVVKEVLPDGLQTQVIAGGLLTSRKGLTLRGLDIDMAGTTRYTQLHDPIIDKLGLRPDYEALYEKERPGFTCKTDLSRVSASFLRFMCGKHEIPTTREEDADDAMQAKVVQVKRSELELKLASKLGLPLKRPRRQKDSTKK